MLGHSPGNIMFDIYFYFELLALIAALVKFKPLLNNGYTPFLPFLVFIVIYETISFNDLYLINGSNIWMVNLVTTVEYLFYSLFIRSLLKSPFYKKAILVTIIISLFYNLTSLFFIHGLLNLNISAIIIQTIIIIIITGRYFWELMEVPFSSSLSIIKLPGFWLNTGVLFFYLGEFMFFASYSYMAYKHNGDYLYLWRFISNMANAVLYTCLTVSFLCLSPTRKLSQL